MPLHEDDDEISYLALDRGTPIVSSSGKEFGNVEHVLQVPELDYVRSSRSRLAIGQPLGRGITYPCKPVAEPVPFDTDDNGTGRAYPSVEAGLARMHRLVLAARPPISNPRLANFSGVARWWRSSGP
jgi:hypothetical protein